MKKPQLFDYRATAVRDIPSNLIGVLVGRISSLLRQHLLPVQLSTNSNRFTDSILHEFLHRFLSNLVC